MSDSPQAVLNQAVLRILRPLVRVLLRHGMAYGTFAELARKAFVDEAFAELERQGRRPTVSAASALTGLTRKEAKRLREERVVGGEQSSQRYNRAIRVISGWLEDPRYHTGTGAPAVLPLDGDSASFASLVREKSGDIPAVSMLSVLEASGNVSVCDGRVTLEARSYLPADTPAERLHILGTDVAELIATIDHNLEAPAGQRYFQRKVSNVRVPPAELEEFRALSNRKSQQLLEEYHAWLSAHELAPSEQGREPAAYVSVGIYYNQQSPPEEDSS